MQMKETRLPIGSMTPDQIDAALRSTAELYGMEAVRTGPQRWTIRTPRPQTQEPPPSDQESDR